MSAKHTPGPWDIGVSGIIRKAGTEILVASIFGMPERIGCDGAVERANALLVTAAPDLLEALEEFMAVSDCNCSLVEFDDGICTHDKARAALAKARGES